LTSYCYKNICRIVMYVYFYESIFQDKSIHLVFTFANSTILWFIFSMFDPNLVLNVSFFIIEGVLRCRQTGSLPSQRLYLIYFLISYCAYIFTFTFSRIVI
jgi:hypothetical protein